MRLQVFRWLGEEFVSLSWEGNGEGTIADEMRELFARFGDWLGRFGLTLDNTVRTRMFVRDIDTWHVAAAERAKCLMGGARSTSSSHVRPERLGPKLRFSIDLLAMHAPKTGERKILREYEPQTVVLRRMTWGKLVGAMWGIDQVAVSTAASGPSRSTYTSPQTHLGSRMFWPTLRQKSAMPARSESGEVVSWPPLAEMTLPESG